MPYEETFEGVVHLIDDDEAVRDSLRFLLETAGLEVTDHASAADFLQALPQLAPGCVVTDVRMPGMSGIDLIRRLNADAVQQPVVVMTGHADVPLAVEAMKAGAADLLEKPFGDEAMLSAVGRALSRRNRTRRQDGERAELRSRMDSLTVREAQVLDGLVSGAANKVIAHDLGISPRTVEIYRANVMTKMKAASLSELVRMTIEAGA